MINYLIKYVVKPIFKLLITFFFSDKKKINNFFRLLYTKVILYTELYLEYYFKLLYIIWKLYEQNKNISYYFLLNP